ncbi:hypothetical protein [Streptomyces sp. NBC_00019]|uniref:hypothetical protein n=1 Tax=Streptomyces sp. NBC_00019 TaxID=2975623 RepID=UPI003247E30C
MSAMEARGERSVSAGGDIGVAVTGDHNVVTLGPSVRSAYREQVRRIAPPELIGRETELAALADFCTTDSGPAYAWWRAEAWAGKTALMSWFALHPPPGVRIVPFFVTARLGAQNDATAYADVVLEQLAELAGEGLPAYLTEATREAHLLRLYGEAARACAESGERLVLLVDGLDEDRGVTTGPEAHSIASLLPPRPQHGMRVLVTGRLNPPPPADVPDAHPLREPGAVQLLSASAFAQVIRAEAERELKHLLTAAGPEYELLALITAAGGGLTADDLAALTGEVPFRIGDILRTRAGRTFQLRSGVYLLAHEELQVRARTMLGPGELGRCRERLHAWADTWRAKGWPEETPTYLFRGYFRMLRADGDLIRMVEAALDESRHDHMFDLTGGDGAALDEIRAAESLNIARGAERRLLESLQLALHREALAGRSGRMPIEAIMAWAELGETGRAETLAQSLTVPLEKARALVALAPRLRDKGLTDTAVTLLAEAEDIVSHSERSGIRDKQAQELGLAYVDLGLYDRAEAVGGLDPGDPVARNRCTHVVRALTVAREFDRVERLLRVMEAYARPAAAGRLTAALEAAGQRERAETILGESGPVERAVAQAYGAAALRRGGRGAEADALCARLEQAVWAFDVLDDVHGVVEALAEEGELACAEAVLNLLTRDERPSARDAQVQRGLGLLARCRADRGEFTQAEEVLRRIRASDEKDMTLAYVAGALAEAGEFDRAEVCASSCTSSSERDFAGAWIVNGLAMTGEFDRARARAAALPGGLAAALAHQDIVDRLAEAGDATGAHALARELADREGGSPHALAGAALRLARSGQEAEARRILADIGDRVRGSVQVDVVVVAEAVQALMDAGHRDAADVVMERSEPVIAEALRLEPESFSYLDRRFLAALGALIRVGDRERARRLLSELPLPMFDDFLLPVVEALASAGAVDEAEELVERQGRRSSAQYRVLVQAQAAAGEFDRARETADTVAPADRVEILRSLAETAASAGAEAFAATCLAEASALEGGHHSAAPRTREPLVSALVALRRHDEATALADEALAQHANGVDLDPADGAALARIVASVGRHEQAMEIVRRILGDLHTRERAWAGLAKLLARHGAYARAEACALAITASQDEAAQAHAAIGREADPARAHMAVVRSLHVGRWTRALPALLRLEPRAVPLVVGAFRQAPTEARTSAPSWK